MARVGIEPGTSRLIAGYLFHCAIMAHTAVLFVHCSVVHISMVLKG